MSVLGQGLSDVGLEDLSFTFSTSSPADFGSVAIGDQILEVEVNIDVAFDDPAALLAFGLVSNPGGILPTNRIDPQTLGTYHSGEGLLVAGASSFRLQITPGTSTVGSGRVTVRIRRV